jgi:hypothetical protein
MLDLNNRALLQVATARAAGAALLNLLRLAGGTPVPVRQAHQRCAG